jgi:hypothetical protein
MLSIPSPDDCIGFVGVAIAAIGILISITLLLTGRWDPWGWYFFLGSGTLWSVSLLYCLAWEWDYFSIRES